MKKIILMLFATLQINYAAGIKSTIGNPASGSYDAYVNLSLDLVTNNAKIVAQWVEIQLTLNQIKEEVDKKKKLLGAVTALEEAKAIALKEQEFLIEQEKNLLGIKNNVEGIKAENESNPSELDFLMLLKNKETK